jgi:hypothetical protein
MFILPQLPRLVTTFLLFLKKSNMFYRFLAVMPQNPTKVANQKGNASLALPDVFLYQARLF